MKDKFASEDWELLKMLPIMVFIMVAGADGNIDDKEKAQLVEDIKKAPFYTDPLHKELGMAIISSDFGELLKKSMDMSKLTERASKMKDALKDKLTKDEYDRFLGSMFINGLKVARSSGGGALGLGDKVSDEEKTALAFFAAMFDLDLTTIEKHFK